MAIKEQPFPKPKGMTKKQVEAMTVNDGEWRESDSFVCRTCGEPSYMHPYTNLIWGCKKCQRTTYSVSVFFRPILSKTG